ncbi:MAG: hypothetical protein JOZ69_05245, partial [Myxococcales bacterium]|nr:hypothetical protein [Myxococcales bacterium]
LRARAAATAGERFTTPESAVRAPAPTTRHPGPTSDALPAGYRTDVDSADRERADAALDDNARRERAHEELRQTFARSKGVNVTEGVRAARAGR